MRMTESLDADSFRRLVEAHASELTRYAAGFLGGDADDARDIVQDAFVRLWQNPPADFSHPRAWLYAVCRTRAIDLLRRRGRMVADDGTVAEATVDDAPTPARTLLEKESASALFALVDTLPAKQREIVRLKFQGDLSYAEIAEVTGLTASNVGFILHTALATLRERAGKRAELKP
jgi:RNA polymerase sigma factor (sigma-70 family)